MRGVLVALLMALPVGAQVPVLGVAGGLAVPTSRFGRPLDVGFDFQASGDFRPIPGPIAFRGDVLWSRFAVSEGCFRKGGFWTSIRSVLRMRLIAGSALFLPM